MSEKNGTQPDPVRFDSPLAKWAGHFTLPALEDFSGAHWNIYRKAMDTASDENPLQNRQFAYAGLELIEKCGTWHLDIPLAEIKAWRKKPEDERMLLVNWLGKSILGYITDLIDPKG
jgi:hypothetical protein